MKNIIFTYKFLIRKQHFVLQIILFLSVFISLAGKRENKKLFKWEQSMIKEVYQIANKKKGYFISLGIASHYYADTALRQAKMEALFVLSEVNKIFVQSICHQEQIVISQNGKDTVISKFVNLIVSRSQINILSKNISFRKLDQVQIGEKYYVASIAIVKRIDLEEGINDYSSERVIEFKKNVEKGFLEIYQDSLYAKYIKNKSFK